MLENMYIIQHFRVKTHIHVPKNKTIYKKALIQTITYTHVQKALFRDDVIFPLISALA